MTTLTLKFELEEQLALAYKQALPKEKAALKKLFEKFLTINLRKQAVEEFLQLTQDIGKEAEANGLTEEMMGEILSDNAV